MTNRTPSELLNYFLELNNGAVKSPIFTDKARIRERSQLLKKLLQVTQELERAQEELQAARVERQKAEDGEGAVLAEIIAANEHLLLRTNKVSVYTLPFSAIIKQKCLRVKKPWNRNVTNWKTLCLRNSLRRRKRTTSKR
jgi:hypothetical protein